MISLFSHTFQRNNHLTKVLVCSEFSELGSGYAVYTKQLIKGLYEAGIEVAELASFCRPDDGRIANCPWKVYPVQPNANDDEGNKVYNSHPHNAFGKYMFEDVLLHWKPSHIINPRDVWNFVYEFTSPLRPFYSHLVMPAIDSDPQNKSWLELYSRADGIVTYCDWATKLLQRCGLTNLYGVASPIPSTNFQPREDKAKLKESIGLGKIKVIGNVMRNQPRKMFAQLFRTFRRFLDSNNRNDIFLYCHTSYPDTWELDELLLEHDVGHKVLFTYMCHTCGNVETSFYKGSCSICHNCKNKNLRMPNAAFPIPEHILGQIYNLFDVYIQYAHLEGYGIPLAEAISSGVHCICPQYSSMETFIDKANATPIKIKDYHIEPETGRRFCIPDDDDTILQLNKFFNLSDEEQESKGKLARLMYGLRDPRDNIEVWINAIRNTKPRLSWNTPKRNYFVPQDFPRNLPSAHFARWLILNVLQDQTYVGSYMEARLVRDLENGYALVGHDNEYYYEAMGISNQRFQPFNQEIAFQHFRSLLQKQIVWENKRCP